MTRPRPRRCVARGSGGAIVDDAVVIIVCPSRDVDRLAGVKRECGAESEVPRRLAGGQQIEFVQPVIIGPSPISPGVVAVGRKKRDAAGVVVSAAERVLNLSGEILAVLPAKRKFQRVCFQISFGLNLTNLAQSRIREQGTPA